MNIHGGSLPKMAATESAEVYSAALAKKQQSIEGQAALSLIESAVNTSQQVAQTPKPSASLGHNIDVYV